MGTRQTRKAGIYKPRKVTDPEVLRALNAIIERLEVLDGLRGDDLDKAVTYRDLKNTGFVLGTGAGGTPTIVNTPGGGISDGGTPVPTIGPAGPPENLAANETFLALLLTWDNTDVNLQHVEVYRADTDNLSLAVMIGTTVSPQFIDYVGASASYYYWVRSVGTDGTKSAFNSTAGTLGTTGINPGNLSIDPRFFVLTDGTGQELPFRTDGAGNIGIEGDLIVENTVRATAIVADSIGAREISTDQVSGIFASFGTMQGGLIRTAAPNAFRVEIEDQAATAYPLWYGSGAKGATTGLFWVDRFGNVRIKGRLDASIIKGTLFTPANASLDYDPFRIATQYNDTDYRGETYVSRGGKLAHLLPMQSVNEEPEHDIAGAFPDQGPYSSDAMRFFGPNYSGNEQYNRFGTYTEMFMVMFSASVQGAFNGGPGAADIREIVANGNVARVTLQYRYGSDAFKNLAYIDISSPAPGLATGSWSQVFASRSTAWSTLDLRLRIESISFDSPYTSGQQGTQRVIVTGITAFSPNFGVADTGRQNVTVNTKLGSLPNYPVMA